LPNVWRHWVLFWEFKNPVSIAFHNSEILIKRRQSMSDTASAPDIEFSLTPVGYVENTINKMTFSPHGKDTPEERQRQVQKNREETRNTISTLRLLPQFEELLDGIEDFSHIVVIYWPHKLSPEDRQIKKVHPMGRKDIPLDNTL
jgi:hypothetical protein